MADDNRTISTDSFKEAVCIDAGRIYDSCCDRDCLEDLRCYFTTDVQALVETATNVRVRSAEVGNVYVDVEPVSFNRGYYACDLTFFFILEFDLFSAPHSKPTKIKGVATYNKKVILYGSEGAVKIYSNEITVEDGADTNALPNSNMPKCVVQCVDPIALTARIGTLKDQYDCCCCIPKCVCDCIGGNVIDNCPAGTPTVYVTLGLFSIVQLIRNVQMLIPVYDFCIPQKQCDDSTDQPCDIFKQIKFPTDDFFPPKCDKENLGGCGCGCK